jgi:GT2 family glycosyltransferase
MASRFSIITVHRNGIERLRSFLRSAVKVIDGSQDSITVVDNHSTDSSIEIAIQEFPNIQFVKNQFNMGYAYACNQGITQSKSEFILICNNDLILPDNILDVFELDFREHPEVGLITGQLINNQGALSTSAGNATTLLTELGFKKNRKLTPQAKIIEVESIVGACMAGRRSAIDDSGMLDPEFFFYYEESEWCYRIRQHDWKILLDSEIIIAHAGGASTKEIFLGARIEYHRSRLLYWKKIFPKYYLMLSTYTIIKMIYGSIYYVIALLATLGKSRKIRNKLKEKIAILIWLAIGKPYHWGLPDKPPKP